MVDGYGYIGDKTPPNRNTLNTYFICRNEKKLLTL